MKTVKKGFSRGLSILLTLLMVLSLTTVGMVGTSAADVTLADTKYSGTDNIYAVSSITSWDANDYSKMTWISDENRFQKVVKGVTPSGDLYFRFRDNYEQTIHPNSGSTVTISPTLGSGYDITDLKYDKNHNDPSWKIDLSQYAASASKIDIYFEFDISSGNKVHLYICESSSSSGGGETGDITISDGKNTHIIIDRNNVSEYTSANPFVYVWDSADTKLLGDWPGTQSKEQDGLFYVGFDYTSSFQFIVNNNSNKQTVDINSNNKGAGDYYYKLVADGDNKTKAELVKFVAYSGGSSGGGGETTTMRTFTAGDMLYIVNGIPSNGWTANWVASDANVKITLINSKTNATTTTDNVQLVSGTDYEAGAVYGASIPNGGEYDQIKIERTASNNDKHYTGTMTLNANDNYNCFADFKLNGTTYTGSVYDSSVVVVSGFYVDMTPDDDTFTDDHIKPTVSGSNYTLYLPSGVDRTAVTIVHGYKSLTIGGQAVASGDKVNLSNDSYQLGGDVSGTLKVYKSQNVSSIHTTTGVAMPQQTGFGGSKEDYSTSGTIVVFDKNGNQVNTDLTLKKIKGRGNSSWQASNDLIGKYAFNITLLEKAKLLDESAAAKKYCLVSYNADQARMRNMVVYELAQQVGLNFSPDYEPVDLYNNGVYVGSYLLTDKVEIGNPLVNIVNLDKANEKVNLELYEASDISTYRGSSNNNINDNSTKGYKKWVNMNEIDASVYAESGFLLEFELNERFADEISGFISDKGQQIVVKYPEYTSKNQIDFVSEKWNIAEALMYNKNATYEQLNAVIDVESFARMYLIQEFTKNLDGCATSFYVYYDEGRFHAGPAWDYDWTLGQYKNDNSGKLNSSTVHSPTSGTLQNTDGWFINSKNIYGAGTLNAQAALCQNEAFWSVVKAEWNESFYDAVKAFTTGTVDNTSGLTGTIAQFYEQVKYSTAMDEAKWHIIKNNPMSSWGSNGTGDTHDAATVFLNNWIFNRQQWMDGFLGVIRSQEKTGIYKVDYVIQPPKVTTDKQSYIAGEDVTLTITDITGGNFTYTIYKDGVELATGVTENTYVDRAVTGTSAQYQVVAHTTTVTSGKSSAKSAPAEIEITGANLDITKIEYPTTAMVGDTLNIKVISNAASFDNITGLSYKLTYGTQELENATGVFSVPVTSGMVNSAYAFTAQVSATVNGELQSVSEDIAVNISDYQMTLTVNVPGSVEVGSVVTITAAANSNSTVTYQLFDITGGAETLLDTNTNGVFTVDIPSDAEVGSTKSYRVVASTTVEGTEYSKNSDFSFTVTEVKDAYTAVIYFKSADSYGYIPLLTTTGAVNDANRYRMQWYEYICKNVTQTASYSWYKSEQLTVSKSSDLLIVNVVSSRYAMEGEITLKMSNYTANADGIIEVYLACDNLNYNPGGVIHDLTNNANRNWTQSATNMIYDEKEVSAATYASVAAMIAPRLVGDVNNDGAVNVKDATLVQKTVANLTSLDADSKYIADVSSDGTISVKDATAIQKRVANL